MSTTSSASFSWMVIDCLFSFLRPCGLLFFFPQSAFISALARMSTPSSTRWINHVWFLLVFAASLLVTGAQLQPTQKLHSRLLSLMDNINGRIKPSPCSLSLLSRRFPKGFHDLGLDKRVLLFSQRDGADGSKDDSAEHTRRLIKDIETSVSDLEGVLGTALSALKLSLNHRWQLSDQETPQPRGKVSEEELRSWKELLRLGGLMAREDVGSYNEPLRLTKKGRTIYRI